MLVFLDWDRLINDEIWGGRFVLASPPFQILGGTRPPRPPVIYAHEDTLINWGLSSGRLIA